MIETKKENHSLNKKPLKHLKLFISLGKKDYDFLT